MYWYALIVKLADNATSYKLKNFEQYLSHLASEAKNDHTHEHIVISDKVTTFSLVKCHFNTKTSRFAITLANTKFLV